ncbi:MAG: restriction endonuclease [Thermoguttaceae bacterium]
MAADIRRQWRGKDTRSKAQELIDEGRQLALHNLSEFGSWPAELEHSPEKQQALFDMLEEFADKETPFYNPDEEVVDDVIEAALTETGLAHELDRPATCVSFVSCLECYVHTRLQYRWFLVEPVGSDDAPRITINSLIIPGDRTKEGTLVKGVSTLWFEIIKMLRDDPGSVSRIDCWKWEELLAGAYKHAGRDTVILTPKRGDGGVDVIVKWNDSACLRFLLLDQMKAYNPGHLIGIDTIREMKGVLLEHPEASKLMISTTSGFTSGAVKAARALSPRLELRPRDELLTWLASVAVEKQVQ